MPPLSGIYSRIPLNTSEISQSDLNIEDKARSNPLPWKGQFSPQLVQVLLDKYASPNSVVLDPFLGSGTVLLEAGRAGVEAFGTELNPAAVTLARMYWFINVPIESRRQHLNDVSTFLRREIPDPLPIFRGTDQVLDSESIKTKLVELTSSGENPYQRQLLEALVVLSDFYKAGLSAEKVLGIWDRLAELVVSLPFSQRRVEVFHSDARRMPLPDSSVDLVITSPPYINVFNYHQQYRASMEAMEWDLLSLAKSEIGANRKHRSNRFLTVVQYCLDIAQTLRELLRVCRPDGRLVFVVGRESMVRGTPLFNGEIVAEVAHRSLGVDLTLRQERVFCNRYGQDIFEDILHFSPSTHSFDDSFLEDAKIVAREVLTAAQQLAPDKAKSDIKSALGKLEGVTPSPIFEHQASYNPMYAIPGGLMFELPTPHGDKLTALLENDKLPESDGPRVEEAIEHYRDWLRRLAGVEGTPQEIVAEMVSLLNEYKFYIDVDLIFDSGEDFLYRQKGQTKVDNTVIEEFLPILVTTVFSAELQGRDLSFGPTQCFSRIWFETDIRESPPGGGMDIKSKAQDFAISRPLFIRASHSPDFANGVTHQTSIAYVAAECKTNLDKTMFQEGIATATDVKTVVPSARYYLLCEWLDMPPINTALTAIDEAIILRGKRLPSSARSAFSKAAGRRENRDFFTKYLETNPFLVESFSRFLSHIRELIRETEEEDVLARGYF